MRVVLMSDIHGNWAALEAVTDAMPESDAVYVAGDLCLDGPEPARVVDRIVERGWYAVVGNTDRDIVAGDRNLKTSRAAAVRWTRNLLGPERLTWLASLPFSLTIDDTGTTVAQVVHANPLNLNEHLRPNLSDEDLRPYMARTVAPLLAFGHLHIPYTRPVGNLLLVDVASVGHPKDYDRRTAFTVIEWKDDRRSVTQVRVPYDIERSVAALRNSDMPDAEKHVHALLKASY